MVLAWMKKHGELNIQDTLWCLVLFPVVTVDTMNVSAVIHYTVKTSFYFVQHASIKALTLKFWTSCVDCRFVT